MGVELEGYLSKFNKSDSMEEFSSTKYKKFENYLRDHKGKEVKK